MSGPRRSWPSRQLVTSTSCTTSKSRLLLIVSIAFTAALLAGKASAEPKKLGEQLAEYYQESNDGNGDDAMLDEINMYERRSHADMETERSRKANGKGLNLDSNDYDEPIASSFHSTEDPLQTILPKVKFNCKGRAEGYYADVDFDCEVFHYCKTNGFRFTFVCPPKSKFNQKQMTCDYDAAEAVCSEVKRQRANSPFEATESISTENNKLASSSSANKFITSEKVTGHSESAKQRFENIRRNSSNEPNADASSSRVSQGSGSSLSTTESYLEKAKKLDGENSEVYQFKGMSVSDRYVSPQNAVLKVTSPYPTLISKETSEGSTTTAASVFSSSPSSASNDYDEGSFRPIFRRIPIKAHTTSTSTSTTTSTTSTTTIRPPPGAQQGSSGTYSSDKEESFQPITKGPVAASPSGSKSTSSVSSLIWNHEPVLSYFDFKPSVNIPTASHGGQKKWPVNSGSAGSAPFGLSSMASSDQNQAPESFFAKAPNASSNNRIHDNQPTGSETSTTSDSESKQNQQKSPSVLHQFSGVNSPNFFSSSAPSSQQPSQPFVFDLNTFDQTPFTPFQPSSSSSGGAGAILPGGSGSNSEGIVAEAIPQLLHQSQPTATLNSNPNRRPDNQQPILTQNFQSSVNHGSLPSQLEQSNHLDHNPNSNHLMPPGTTMQQQIQQIQHQFNQPPPPQTHMQHANQANSQQQQQHQLNNQNQGPSSAAMPANLLSQYQQFPIQIQQQLAQQLGQLGQSQGTFSPSSMAALLSLQSHNSNANNAPFQLGAPLEGEDENKLLQQQFSGTNSNGLPNEFMFGLPRLHSKEQSLLQQQLLQHQAPSNLAFNSLPQTQHQLPGSLGGAPPVPNHSFMNDFNHLMSKHFNRPRTQQQSPAYRQPIGNRPLRQQQQQQQQQAQQAQHAASNINLSGNMLSASKFQLPDQLSTWFNKPRDPLSGNSLLMAAGSQYSYPSFADPLPGQLPYNMGQGPVAPRPRKSLLSQLRKVFSGSAPSASVVKPVHVYHPSNPKFPESLGHFPGFAPNAGQTPNTPTGFTFNSRLPLMTGLASNSSVRFASSSQPLAPTSSSVSAPSMPAPTFSPPTATSNYNGSLATQESHARPVWASPARFHENQGPRSFKPMNQPQLLQRLPQNQGLRRPLPINQNSSKGSVAVGVRAKRQIFGPKNGFEASAINTPMGAFSTVYPIFTNSEFGPENFFLSSSNIYDEMAFAQPAHASSSRYHSNAFPSPTNYPRGNNFPPESPLNRLNRHHHTHHPQFGSPFPTFNPEQSVKPSMQPQLMRPSMPPPSPSQQGRQSKSQSYRLQSVVHPSQMVQLQSSRNLNPMKYNPQTGSFFDPIFGSQFPMHLAYEAQNGPENILIGTQFKNPMIFQQPQLQSLQAKDPAADKAKVVSYEYMYKPVSISKPSHRRPPNRDRIPVKLAPVSYEKVNLPPVEPTLSYNPNQQQHQHQQHQQQQQQQQQPTQGFQSTLQQQPNLYSTSKQPAQYGSNQQQTNSQAQIEQQQHQQQQQPASGYGNLNLVNQDNSFRYTPSQTTQQNPRDYVQSVANTKQTSTPSQTGLDTEFVSNLDDVINGFVNQNANYDFKPTTSPNYHETNSYTRPQSPPPSVEYEEQSQPESPAGEPHTYSNSKDANTNNYEPTVTEQSPRQSFSREFDAAKNQNSNSGYGGQVKNLEVTEQLPRQTFSREFDAAKAQNSNSGYGGQVKNLEVTPIQGAVPTITYSKDEYDDSNYETTTSSYYETPASTEKPRYAYKPSFASSADVVTPQKTSFDVVTKPRFSNVRSTVPSTTEGSSVIDESGQAPVYGQKIRSGSSRSASSSLGANKIRVQQQHSQPKNNWNSWSPTEVEPPAKAVYPVTTTRKPPTTRTHQSTNFYNYPTPSPADSGYDSDQELPEYGPPSSGSSAPHIPLISIASNGPTWPPTTSSTTTTTTSTTTTTESPYKSLFEDHPEYSDARGHGPVKPVFTAENHYANDELAVKTVLDYSKVSPQPVYNPQDYTKSNSNYETSYTKEPVQGSESHANNDANYDDDDANYDEVVKTEAPVVVETTTKEPVKLFKTKRPDHSKYVTKFKTTTKRPTTTTPAYTVSTYAKATTSAPRSYNNNWNTATKSTTTSTTTEAPVTERGTRTTNFGSRVSSSNRFRTTTKKPSVSVRASYSSGESFTTSTTPAEDYEPRKKATSSYGSKYESTKLTTPTSTKMTAVDYQYKSSTQRNRVRYQGISTEATSTTTSAPKVTSPFTLRMTPSLTTTPKPAMRPTFVTSNSNIKRGQNDWGNFNKYTTTTSSTTAAPTLFTGKLQNFNSMFDNLENEDEDTIENEETEVNETGYESSRVDEKTPSSTTSATSSSTTTPAPSTTSSSSTTAFTEGYEDTNSGTESASSAPFKKVFSSHSGGSLNARLSGQRIKLFSSKRRPGAESSNNSYLSSFYKTSTSTPLSM